PPTIRVFTALHAAQTAAVLSGGAEIVDPLCQAYADADSALALRAGECLRQLEKPEAIDAVCSRWLERREAFLAQAIEKAGYVARQPPAARVWSALLAGKLDAVTDGGAEVIAPLLQAGADTGAVLAEHARRVLGQLKQPETRDALCRLALESDQPLAREAALAAQYAPRDPKQRALFFFLTEQWGKYEALDFDQSMLGAAYELGDRKLRGRIAEKVRRAGRPDWVGTIAGSRQDRRLHDMADEDWEATLAVLGESGRWPELWRLAQAAPVTWAVWMVERLKKAGWVPPRESPADFERLCQRAENCLPSLPSQAAAGTATSSGLSARSIRPATIGLGRATCCQARLEGHQDYVGCLAVSGDGRFLATGSNDHSVKLRALADGAELKTLAGHTDWVAAVAISPDGRFLASASIDGTARLWRLPEGELVKNLAGHAGEIRCLAFSPDGCLLATGSGDHTVRLWRMPDGEALAVLEGHSDIVSCLAMRSDGRLLASGGYDKSIRLWSLPDGQPVASLPGHKELVNCLAFNPEGTVLASGSKDRTLMLWSLPAGTRLRRLKGHHDDVTCLAISPDGTLLASGSWDSTVRLWSCPGGEPVNMLGSIETMDGHTGWVMCLTFSPDGHLLASGGLDNTARLWSVNDGTLIKTLEGHDSRVTCVAFSPDGATLASGSWDRTVRLWRSELSRLSRVPIARTTLDDLAWTQEALSDYKLAKAERDWLEFLHAMMHWRRRHDIQLGETARIEAGEFDIEIEG
ncbi:MAG: hypothetical protein HY674_03770, partial [Chloroflexi bacterium]|nr:hypothetical protein [Chloroflexota bacterium]